MTQLTSAMQGTSASSLIGMVILQLIAGKILKKMLAYFYVCQLLSLILQFKWHMPVNMETVMKGVKDTIELNALPKEEIKEALTSAPPV